MRQAVKAQIRYLEVLKENRLLDQALNGQLPAHIVKAAKQVVISEMTGSKTNKTGDVLYVSPEDHEEAERELDEFLKHYRLEKDLRQILRRAHNTPIKGKKYFIRFGYFAGKSGIYKGTDIDVFGRSWLENFGNDACEKFAFRAQRDNIDLLNGNILVFKLSDEDRDVLIHEKEVGSISN